MLIRFEVSNYRSINDPVELSMIAVDDDRSGARAEPLLGESVLTLAAVYGPNASGKSNVVSALAWLRDAVRHSVRAWDDHIPLEQFAFAGDPRPSQFVFESTIDGVRFEYLLELDPRRVHYEGLFHYPEKKRRRIFERDGTDLKLQRGLGGLSGTRELLTDRVLALSLARRFDEPLVNRFAADIIRLQVFGLPRPGTNRADVNEALRLLGLHSRVPLDAEAWFGPSSPADRDQALALLRLADLGIEDVLFEEQEVPVLGSGAARTERMLRLVHKTAGDSVPLDFSAESEGTKAWFRLIGPVLTALRDGTVFVFDELDASLHPTLSVELLRLFSGPATNPHGAQLIFTTHDTSLLNHLNRDEVWLTEKRPDGATRLGALAEFAGERVRKSQNLETAYLHGRFGALPQLDQTALLRVFQG